MSDFNILTATLQKIKKKNLGQNKNILNFLANDYEHDLDGDSKLVGKAVAENVMKIELYNGNNSSIVVSDETQLSNTVPESDTQKYLEVTGLSVDWDKDTVIINETTVGKSGESENDNSNTESFELSKCFWSHRATIRKNLGSFNEPFNDQEKRLKEWQTTTKCFCNWYPDKLCSTAWKTTPWWECCY